MGERRGTQRVAGATRVLPLRAAALRVPSRPLPCATIWRRGLPRCGGSQLRQRGEKPKLRGHAAAQVVALKVPARGAPERGHG